MDGESFEFGKKKLRIQKYSDTGELGLCYDDHKDLFSVLVVICVRSLLYLCLRWF